MSQSWDDFDPKEYQEFSEEWGKEALRVLKPGGYLLSFSGTRTYHRMVTGLEDAGFEIQDMISYMYGSGFPKSHDISKAIDSHLFKEWLDENPDIKKKYKKELDDAESTKEREEVKKKYKKKGNFCREVVGEKTTPDGKAYSDRTPNSDGEYDTECEHNSMSAKTKHNNDITAPATEEAKQWEGWQTSLKPSHEPIVLAQKPREGTYAENVLKYGCGGLNIQDCRIETEENLMRPKRRGKGNVGNWNDYEQEEGKYGTPEGKGRFPANIIIDPVSAQLLDEQSGVSKSSGGVTREGHFQRTHGEFKGSSTAHEGGLGDEGGASRFFYSAKAHKSERNAGLDEYYELKDDVPEDIKKEIEKELEKC